MSTHAWTVAEAKAKFSEVLDRAQSEGPRITRHGRTTAMVVAANEWKRKTNRKGNLAEFLLLLHCAAPGSTQPLKLHLRKREL